MSLSWSYWEVSAHITWIFSNMLHQKSDLLSLKAFCMAFLSSAVSPIFPMQWNQKLMIYSVYWLPSAMKATLFPLMFYIWSGTSALHLGCGLVFFFFIISRCCLLVSGYPSSNCWFVSSPVFYTNICHVLALHYADLFKSPYSLTFFYLLILLF